MIKNYLLAMALLSLMLAIGCAKGGNGIVPPPLTVDISTPTGISNAAIYPTQSVVLTAAVTGTSSTALSWSLSPGSGSGTCTASTCGTLTVAANTMTATYVATATATSATVTATLTSDTSVTGTLTMTVGISSNVTPVSPNVGSGLTQQFTAVAVPNYAPQTFTWTCTASGVACANFSVPNSAAPVAIYTAADSCSGNCVQISAASTLDPTACSNGSTCTIAKFPLVTSRVNGTYAFRFSGYDNSNAATAMVGTFTASNGTITMGAEDELTSSGPSKKISITGGSYTPISASDPNSNNAGTLTLTLPAGVYPNEFQVVLDGNGDIEMIESDSHGTGSGIAQKSSGTNLLSGDQTFAFGFTGADSSGNRVGYVGILPMNTASGSGTISGGQMDTNDNGSATNICGTGPCSITNASYTADSTSPIIPGLWHMTLTPGSAAAMHFDFFISSGSATSKSTPLIFYAISTDPVATHPAVSGTMVLQDSTQTYNNAAFDGTSVSALTGTNGGNTNVSLTLGSTDGNGDFSGQYDQNNAGTILSAIQFPGSSTSYTYTASGSTNGRYTFNMLGNPSATTVVAPLPFILYASGANRGFLLDQNSSSVMTGPMNPQGKGGGILSTSELTATYGAATTGSGTSGVEPIAANLMLTFANTGTCTSDCVSGTLYTPAAQPITGANPAYSLMQTGPGTIALTVPPQNYAIYIVDTSGTCSFQNPTCAIQDFFMIDEDKTNPNPSIIFAKQ